VKRLYFPASPKIIILNTFLVLSFVFVAFFGIPMVVRAETYTGNISINSNGGGNCILVGSWDEKTKTCTLDKDISGTLAISSTGILLDGAGHIISRDALNSSRNGITVGASSTALKNINVTGFTNCVVFNGGIINVYVENSNITNCGSNGIYLPTSSGGHTFVNNNISQSYLGIFVNSSNNTIEGNTFSTNNTDGVRTNFSSENIIKNNIFSDNGFGLRIYYGIGNKVTGNTIQNNRSYGLYATSSSANQNYIVNNNFISNGDGQVSIHDINQYFDGLSVGGNYWSDYDEPSEGCDDINLDGFCDQPKYFSIYNPSYGDFYPWTKSDGWKNEPVYEKAITSFSFKSLIPNVDGVIDETGHTIVLNVPFGTDISALIPIITVSTGASVSPESGTAQDFSSPVTYTVTAGDGSTQAYVVTVTATCITDCFSSVLFLPGLEASRLYDASGDQLWEPDGNSDVEKLYLNVDGTSKNNVYTRDVIREASGVQNIYKSFADMLGEMVDNFTITSYGLFAYDWRQSVEDIVSNGTKYQDGNKSLVDTLEELAASSKSGKVTIVAHSNGGLLAKALLQKLKEDKEAGINNLIDNVDVLILVAVPEIGTASSVPVILHGYDQRILLGFLLDEVHARELARNMKSAYGLLPSVEYINRVSASPVTFKDTVIPSGVTTNLVQVFGSAIDSYSEYKSFLFGEEGRSNPGINQINLPIVLSEDLFGGAENLHEEIDSWTPPENLRVIEIAGWGLDTIASFEYYPKQLCSGLNCTFILDQRPRYTKDGDKTVVVPSAHYMHTGGKAESYWVDLPRYNRFFNFSIDRKHKDILEVDSLNNLIGSVLKNESIVLDDVLKTSKPLDTSNRLRLSIHSPVTLDAYDHEGNHTGKICPTDSEFCYVEENILNSSYLEFGEGKYINLPEEEMAKVKLKGVDIGIFTYESEKVLPDDTSTTSSFISVPVTTQTEAEITLNETTLEPEMQLDINSDGINDFTVQSNQDFDPILYLEIMKATVDSLDLPEVQKIVFTNRINAIIKLIENGKIDQGKLQVENFKFTFETQVSKANIGKSPFEQISETDAEFILQMFNILLNNMN